MSKSNWTPGRRDMMKLAAAGLLSGVSVPWFEQLVSGAIQRPRGKSCILLWMDGGPSQQHTFDPKEHGEFKPKPTSVPGIPVEAVDLETVLFRVQWVSRFFGNQLAFYALLASVIAALGL
ncbi:MAG: DUF1501 domain-containing protein, partial [Pirellulaceae bacterium]|nr:DUF1501 domain-containing protein [Pirellulaceae bacterium]